jgi:hypothetical protein
VTDDSQSCGRYDIDDTDDTDAIDAIDDIDDRSMMPARARAQPWGAWPEARLYHATTTAAAAVSRGWRGCGCAGQRADGQDGAGQEEQRGHHPLHGGGRGGPGAGPASARRAREARGRAGHGDRAGRPRTRVSRDFPSYTRGPL